MGLVFLQWFSCRRGAADAAVGYGHNAITRERTSNAIRQTAAVGREAIKRPSQCVKSKERRRRGWAWDGSRVKL
jgi:hypothetical protein